MQIGGAGSQVSEETDDMKRSRRLQRLDELNTRQVNYKIHREAQNYSQERSQGLQSMVQYNKRQLNHKTDLREQKIAHEKMFHEHKMEAVSPISMH